MVLIPNVRIAGPTTRRSKGPGIPVASRSGVKRRSSSAMRWFTALVLIAAPAILAPHGAFAGSAVDSLNRFYEQVRTFSASFEQVVLDEGLNPIEESSGIMQIARPGRFRWDYEPPNEQIILSDGERVWVYDIELEQITVRSQEQSLGRTPAALLAGAGDIQSSYRITDLGQTGALSWVSMKPSDEEGGFSDLRIGFEQDRLRVMELVDGLGQTTRITLSNASENGNIDDSRFVLVPPAGVDVIDETQ